MIGYIYLLSSTRHNGNVNKTQHIYNLIAFLAHLRGQFAKSWVKCRSGCTHTRFAWRHNESFVTTKRRILRITIDPFLACNLGSEATRIRRLINVSFTRVVKIKPLVSDWMKIERRRRKQFTLPPDLDPIALNLWVRWTLYSTRSMYYFTATVALFLFLVDMQTHTKDMLGKYAFASKLRATNTFVVLFHLTTHCLFCKHC